MTPKPTEKQLKALARMLYECARALDDGVARLHRGDA